MLCVLLAGGAGWLSVGTGGPASARLRRALPAPAGPSRTDGILRAVARSSLPARAPAAAGVLAAALVTVGETTAGVALAVLSVAVAVPRRRRAAEARRLRAATARDVPRAADLIATCLDAGAPPSDAVGVIGDELGGPVAGSLRPVAAALRAGVDPAAAWALADASSGDALARLGRAYVRGAATGAPLARGLRAVASDERARSRAEAEAAARRAGVRAIGPLAVCFLPAFLLLGVLPVVVGMASQVLGDLG